MTSQASPAMTPTWTTGKERFVALIQEHNPDLLTYAEDLYDIFDKGGIDPIFALAVFWHESKMGKHGPTAEQRRWAAAVRESSHSWKKAAKRFVKTCNGVAEHFNVQGVEDWAMVLSKMGDHSYTNYRAAIVTFLQNEVQ